MVFSLLEFCLLCHLSQSRQPSEWQPHFNNGNCKAKAKSERLNFHLFVVGLRQDINDQSCFHIPIGYLNDLNKKYLLTL